MKKTEGFRPFILIFGRDRGMAHADFLDRQLNMSRQIEASYEQSAHWTI